MLWQLQKSISSGSRFNGFPNFFIVKKDHEAMKQDRYDCYHITPFFFY